MSLHAGAKLGPYEIVAPIGAGGMGEVYRARDGRLKRDVAIKILPQHLSQAPTASERFVREAEALAALSHPNLLTIFDTGIEEGIAYAVTELLEGEALRAKLAKGALPWREAVEIGVALAEGLAAAHSRGVTHRDVKPENVFLTLGGQVKLLDFGLAQLQPADAAPDAAGITLTAGGAVIGTAGYLSPEQARGAPAGPASDIFSLGCVLYEMIAGKRAFPGDNFMQVVTSVLCDTPPDLASACAQAPLDLKRVVERCLEKNPEQRFQSARDLAFQMRAILSSASTGGGSGMAAGITPAGMFDSIAVLPFQNAGGDPDTEYLSDGLTESILNSLSGIAGLRVIPRSTVFRHKGKDYDPLALGRELNVRVVLTGRVVQRGEVLVVGTELIDVPGGSQLWGERYNRKLADIFALEEDIARKISDTLRTKLSGEDRKRLGRRYTENTEAYQLYLKGRHHWIRRTGEHLIKAAEYFQKAIEKDPGYALAYSGLADCYTLLGIYSIIPPRDAIARAKAAAAAAVALDDELAEAHNSLAFIRGGFDCDWQAARREFERAMELNPGLWVAPYWYGLILTSMGHFDEAESHIRRAIELEPLSPVVWHGAAMNSLGARRIGEAIERCWKGLESASDHFLLRFWLGLAYQEQGRYPEAISELEKAVALSGGKVSWVQASLGSAHAVAGNRAEAMRILDDLLERSGRETIDATAPLLIYAALGDVENAIKWLEHALALRGMLPILIKWDSRFDVLRPDLRFQSALQRLNLAG